MKAYILLIGGILLIVYLILDELNSSGPINSAFNAVKNAVTAAGQTGYNAATGELTQGQLDTAQQAEAGGIVAASNGTISYAQAGAQAATDISNLQALPPAQPQQPSSQGVDDMLLITPGA